MLRCGPYLATEKLERIERFAPSFATQPTIGSVTSGSAAPARDCATKSSAALPSIAGPSAMLSKYQSPARFVALIRQFYRLVAFPPERFSGTLSSRSSAVSANATP